jgi:hypothetical protein
MTEKSRQLPILPAAAVCLLMSVGILVLGLNPEDFKFANNVTWLQPPAGLAFGKYGLAYSEPFDWSDLGQDQAATDKWSLEVALNLDHKPQEGFSFIFTLHDGDDQSQVVLGQWRHALIVMKGDDYDHSRNLPRLTYDMTPHLARKSLLTISSGPQGTRLFVDGKLVKRNKALKLMLPGQNGKVRLTVGNSVYGIHSWRGHVYGLALYNDSLGSDQAANHFRQWEASETFTYAVQDDPALLYLLTEGQGALSREQVSGVHHLVIPSHMPVLKKAVLGFPFPAFKFNYFFIEDFVINLVGFMPFGFILTITMAGLKGKPQRYSVLWAVGVGFLLSLFIEVTQAWLPSRTSSMIDLGLNTTGTWLGAVSAKMIKRQDTDCL